MREVLLLVTANFAVTRVTERRASDLHLFVTELWPELPLPSRDVDESREFFELLCDRRFCVKPRIPVLLPVVREHWIRIDTDLKLAVSLPWTVDLVPFSFNVLDLHGVEHALQFVVCN